MKRILTKYTLVLMILSVAATTLFAQNEANQNQKKKSDFYVMCDEGAAYTKITRLVLNDSKNNYIFEDYMVGAFLTIKTDYFKPLNPIERIAVYTPFSTEFNNVEQERKRLFIAVDSFTGIDCKFDIKGNLNVNFGPGIHFLYEYTDRFNYFNLGLGGYINCEFPLTYNWTLLLDGVGSIDLGNIGSNRLVEYYNYVWQWQTGIGFRYTTKSPNKSNYAKETEEMYNAKMEAKRAKKQAKKDARDAKKIKPEEKKDNKKEIKK